MLMININSKQRVDIHSISLFILICIGLQKSVSAQAPEISWQNTIGGDGLEGANVVISTPDYGFLVGGSSSSGISGDKTIEDFGSGDSWLLKLNAEGNIVWQSAYGGSSPEGMECLSPTADGGFILGCSSFSEVSGNKTAPAYGSCDAWVIKIDAAGTIEWQNTYGGSLNDYITAIHQTADGGYILGLQSNSPISGNKSEAALSSEIFDYWIVKIDAFGNIEWQNTIGTTSADLFTDLIVTSDGNYFVSGWTYGGISGDKTVASKGAIDFWALQLDPAGSIIWQKAIGGLAVDVCRKVVETQDGGFVLIGSSNSNIGGDKSENQIGPSIEENDYWVVKLNAAGEIEWDNTIGGKNEDNATDGLQLSDGGYLIGGISLSNISGDKTEDRYSNLNDYWVVRLDPTGNVLWDKTLGGTGAEYLNALNVSPDGRYVFAGSSTSNISGDKTEDCLGIQDIWIIALNPEV